MANENDIGGKVGLDITDFKANIAELNRQIKVIDSGFKAAAAGMDDWSKSEEGLLARIKSLNDITDLQRQKIANLTAQYEKIAAEKGANSKAAQDLLVRINKETESLNKNESELRKATEALDGFGKETDDASDKTNKFDGVLDKLGKGLSSVGGTIAKTAAVGIAAVGTAAVGAAAGALKFATDVGTAADDLLTLSNQTGISAQQLQEWDYAMRFIDVDMDVMTKSMAKLIKNMDSAAKGTKDQVDAFERLGVSFQDGNGQLRDSQTVFNELIGALGNVENETERDALAMRLFGKSAQELNPLIKAGTDELARLSQEAHNVGAVLSDEALEAAGQFDDMMQTLTASAKGLAANIGVAVLPAVSQVVNTIAGIVPQITQAIQTGDWASAGQAVSAGFNGLLENLTNSLPGLATMASTIISGLAGSIIEAIPQALPALVEAVILLLQTIVQVLSDNGPMLITAAVQAVVTLAEGIVESLPQIIDVAIELIKTLADALIENLPKILDAAVEIVLALVDGILELLPELIPVAIDLIVTLAEGIIDALPKLIEKIPQIVETIVRVIVENLPLLIDAALKIIMALVKALIENLPLLIEAAIELIGALVTGMVGAIPSILAVVPQIFSSLIQAFKEIKWGELGINLINGITDGVKSAAKNLTNSVVNAAENALESVKDFLGIRSPSRVMRDEVGKMIGAGMAEGIAASSRKVNAAMEALNTEVTSMPAVSGTSSRAASSETIYQFNFEGMMNGASFVVRSDADIPAIAKEVANVIYSRGSTASRGMGVLRT